MNREVDFDYLRVCGLSEEQIKVIDEAFTCEDANSGQTGEDAIKKLKDILAEATETDNSVCYVTSDDADALKAAIEALEQELCDKCVYSTNEGCQYDDITEAIPPVDPQPKTGYWIEDAGTYYKAIHERGCEPDENTPIFLDDIACSECLAKFSVIDNETERFECCPHCGAKMVEPQESEEV